MKGLLRTLKLYCFTCSLIPSYSWKLCCQGCSPNLISQQYDYEIKLLANLAFAEMIEFPCQILLLFLQEIDYLFIRRISKNKIFWALMAKSTEVENIFENNEIFEQEA